MPVKDTQAKRISPARLQKAKKGLTAIGQLKDYDPKRKEFNATAVAAVQKDLKDTAEAELAAENALAAARDAATKSEWAAHEFLQGAAEQVVGQYGSSSDEYASIGYKKKTEYKKATPHTKAPKKAAGSSNA